MQNIKYFKKIYPCKIWIAIFAERDPMIGIMQSEFYLIQFNEQCSIMHKIKKSYIVKMSEISKSLIPNLF